MNLQRSMLAKVREEVGFMWNMSSNFEQISVDYPVISAYERWPTSYKVGFMRNRKDVLVDRSFATTNVPGERLIQVDADHFQIYTISPQTLLEEAITRLALTVKQATSPSALGTVNSTLEADDVAAALDQLWLNTPAASRIAKDDKHIHSSQQDSLPPDSGVQSPEGATIGSSNVAAGYEIVPAAGAVAATTPAVKLPCYMVKQHSRAGGCIGRDNVLEMIDEALLPTAPGAELYSTQEIKSFAICGLGGLGKTQIALEFARTRKRHFDAIFFVYADSLTKLAESFDNIAKELGLADKTQVDNSVVNRDRVLEWLNLPLKHARGQDNEDVPLAADAYANYLLIFDNADEPELLTEYWPMTGTGSILVTSRDPLTKSRIYSNNGIDLEPLDQEHAAQLLQSLTGYDSPSDHEVAVQIATRMGGLPLALQQIAGRIQRKHLTFREFLGLYEKPAFQQDVHQSKERGFGNAYERMLLDVWSLDNLKPEAVRLLECCALLDPDRIPESIFLAEDNEVPGSLSDPMKFEVARTDLIKGSLVKRLHGQSVLTVHRVLQDSIRVRMPSQRFCDVFVAVMNMIIRAWPSQALSFAFEPTLWTTYGILLPHIEHLIEMLERAVPFKESADDAGKFVALLVKAGWYQHERGNYEDALSMFEKASHIVSPWSTVLGRIVADIDFCITNSTSFTKDWGKRALSAERNMAYRLAHPDDVFNLAIAHNEMSYYYNEQGRYRDAVHHGLQALAVYQHMEMYRTGEALAINPRINIAHAHYWLGELAEAESYALRCLERIEMNQYEWDFNANRTGNTLYILGNIRRMQGALDESFVLYKRSLDHYKSTLGELHAHTLKVYVKVADHYTQRGEFELAT
ncbi:hypothetical protein A1O1_02474 [Capronia coronata CBS 617.96]|uniref:Uncharacterized protein n=1 Tax=Capronia coronata CBS 617.96 TaxID=1182541 RepID=W9YXT2_9EURO|nr:uncharacterized protein A1O1_02474 [Capronia coronata CBS 617.96]EXJ94081.1 hypothetical protein A1O1_02474 [Capronia coronata CBS 617.96]